MSVEDYNKTIAATIMSEKAKGDWGAYSAGHLIDATLYNIRCERRCEFVMEGHRETDLRFWRAMDQMITTPSQCDSHQKPVIPQRRKESHKINRTVAIFYEN